MKSSSFIAVAFCAVLWGCSFQARADFMATATINAAQELDPVTMKPPSSTATGNFTLDYSSTANMLTYTLTYSGLTSPTTMAHIHFGPPGISGAPIFTLYDYGVPPSMTKTSDVLSGSLSIADFMPDAADGVTSFAQAITDIQDGITYVNIHSANYPAGEIRGQIISSTGSLTAVPEEPSLILVALGAMASGGMALRRRFGV